MLAGAALVEGVDIAAVAGVVAEDDGGADVAGVPAVAGTIGAVVTSVGVAAVVTGVVACPELHDDATKMVTMSATAVVRI